MEYHPLLSNDEYYYISSQTSKLPKKFNKSQMRLRIKEKVEKTFKTFESIYYSRVLEQKYKDELFSPDQIKWLAEVFTNYDKSNPITNEQSIARVLVEVGFNYYKQRYQPINFIANEIQKIEGLLRVLESQAKEEELESKGMKMYRARSKNKKPPILLAEKDFWQAECMYCFNQSLHHAQTENESIKNVKHDKDCLYLQDVKKFGWKYKKETTFQYVRTFPPRDLKKKR